MSLRRRALVELLRDVWLAYRLRCSAMTITPSDFRMIRNISIALAIVSAALLFAGVRA